jgi:serine/threonine protein kinase
MALMDPEVDPNAPTRPDSNRVGPVTGAPLPAGKLLGGYRIVRELGRGGMGVVYLAHDDALQRDVALKVLQPKLASDPEFGQRFIREARTAAKLEHPNVVPVYSAGRDGDVLFMAMRFVPGRSLHELLQERGGRLPVREALEITRQAARGLGAAHAAALVHRDVKPQNLMVDEAGVVKVMDFGLMRSWRDREGITEPGVFYGTPEYASPEQCEGAELDGRADLYSLGAVLYEMLGGRRPHSGNTPMALFKKILEEPPAALRSLNAEVPPAVEAVVARMMAKRPEDRYASAADLERALDALLQGGAPAGRGSRRGLLAAVATLALTATLAAFWTGRSAVPESPTPSTSESRLRLVVFDLKNGIPKPESAWYSIALSDLLIAALSKRPQIDVPTRDQLLWTMKQRELAGQAGEEQRRTLTGSLGAKAYVSGTYYVQGSRLRLTLAGYRLPENALLFPELSFDGSAEDLLGVADRAAAELARALKLEPEAQALDRVEKGAEDPQARRKSLGADGAAAAPPAPATLAGGNRLRELKKQQSGAPQGVDWTRAWYENRKALEGLQLKKEDFDELTALLVREFALRKSAPANAEQAAKAPSSAAPKSGSASALPARVEFACPDCRKAVPGFVPCVDCERFPVLRLKP